MRRLRRFLKRIDYWRTKRQDEERLQAEIEEHLSSQTAENFRAGLAPEEARRQALLKFGAVEAMREAYRDQRGLPSLELLVQDIRHALRRLRMTPTFTVVTVLVLSLGIGATTAIFTLVHAVLLKSLPVSDPDELYRLGKEARCCYDAGYSQEKEFSLVSYDLYKYFREHTNGFSELAAFPAISALFGVRRAGSAEVAQGYPGEFVSGNYFRMFGVNAYAGRMLTAEDDNPGAAPAAVMSYRLWQQRYGSDPAVIGAVFNVDDKPFTVVGITPPGFFGDSLRSSPPDLFLPLNTEPYVQVDADLKKYDLHWLQLIGRIRPGARPAAIEAEMRVELKQWLRLHWGEMSPNDRIRYPQQTLNLRPAGAGITGMREQYEHWLKILMLVSGFVLLTVCANVANLMLVRGMERRRQTSLSMALGAQVSRVVRQALIESLLLALLGGAAGLAFAYAGTRLILNLAFPGIPGMAGVPIDAAPSLPVLLFASLTSLATGIFFGIGPAWLSTRVDPIEALRGSGRSTARQGAFSRNGLVVLQTALSLVLLSASALLTSALQRLEHQDFGFEQERRIVANINPRLAGYQTGRLPLLYRRIHDSIAKTPGIAGVALCLYSPLAGGGWGSGIWVDGRPAPSSAGDNFAAWNRVTSGYLDVVGTPIVRGRGILEQDTARSPKVAVVNEAFARKFFAHEDPIGKHFGMEAGAAREFEIAGVVKDARYLTFNLTGPIRPFFFLPEAQADFSRSNQGSLFLHDVVLLTRPGATLSAVAVRQALADVDPNLPVTAVRSLSEQVAGQFSQQRLIARLTSLFGVLALLLASMGLYGVTAYTAARRVGEIGVRMALGANRGTVIRLVLGGASALILFGLVIGLPLTFIVGQFLGNQLYGVNPYDPKVTLAAVIALALSGMAASFFPALRASRISPSEALRAE